MVKFFKRLVILCMFVGLGYGGYHIYTETNLFKITSIELTKHPQIDIKTITQYSGLKSGDFYLSVNTFNLEEKMKAHPYVKTVSVKKIFPNKVIFTFTFREHLFNLYHSDIVLSLDEHLTVLSVLDEPKEGYTVQGFAFDSFSVGTPVKVSKKYVLENIVLLIDLLGQSQIKADHIITFEKSDIILKVGGIRGNFGLGNHIEKKFNDFMNIYDALITDKIESGTIDVSSEGLPIYRPFGE